MATFDDMPDSEVVALIEEILACETKRIPGECFAEVPWLHDIVTGDGILDVMVGTMPSKDEMDVVGVSHAVWMRWWSGVEKKPGWKYGPVYYRRIVRLEPQQESGPCKFTAEVDPADIQWAHPSIDPATLLTPAGKRLVSEDDRTEVHSRRLLHIWNDVVRKRTFRTHRAASEKLSKGEGTFEDLYGSGASRVSNQCALDALSGEAKLSYQAKLNAQVEAERVEVARTCGISDRVGNKIELAALREKLAAVRSTETQLKNDLTKTIADRKALEDQVRDMETVLVLEQN